MAVITFLIFFSRFLRFFRAGGLVFALFLTVLSAPACFSGGWKTASRASAGLAPLPEASDEAVVQVYRAPLWGFRGLIADHTWIAAKKTGASFYMVYEVIGWRKFDKAPVLRAEKDIPDRLWFGNRPTVLADLRGEKANQAAEKIRQAALEYPYKREYSMLFGPNSNTWTAWTACRVPELNLKLPRRAVGKNYIKDCPQNP